MKRFLILVSIACLLISSCSVSHWERGNKDVKLDREKLLSAGGEFKAGNQAKLLTRFTSGPELDSNWIVRLQPVTERLMNLHLARDDSVMYDQQLKGRLKKNGYFKIRSEVRPKGIAGPLLWGLVEKHRAVGFTKENDLVLMMVSGGSVWTLCIPLGASGGNMEGEFKRKQ